MRKPLVIWSFCLVLVLAEEMAKEAIEQLIRALELMIESIPQYELPEINEDGDIIIRRKRRPSEKPADPESEETAT